MNSKLKVYYSGESLPRLCLWEMESLGAMVYGGVPEDHITLIQCYFLVRNREGRPEKK